MKQFIYFGTLILCPLLFALSCDKSEMEYDAKTVSPTYRTITLQFPEDNEVDPAMRVSLAADGKTAWEAGDEIFIHGSHVGHSGETYYSRTITLAGKDISADGKTATFTMEDIAAKPSSWRTSGYKATLFAAYPASAIKNYSDGDIWYYSSAFSNTNALLLAGCNDVSVNDGNTFQFRHLSGALSFIVSGDFDSYVFSGKGGTEVVGYNVFSVRVDAENSFDDKKGYIPYNGGSGGIATSGPQHVITGPVVADGTTVNYIFFPAGVNLSSGFIIKFKKGGEIVKTLSTSTAKNIEIGKYLPLGDVTSHLKTYTPPVHNATTPAISGATDLSAGSSANCYVVNGGDNENAGKVYKFKAYKGNSTTNAGTIQSVEILWETYNNTSSVSANSVIAAVDFDKQNANSYYEICFQMPATLHTGNALIAAKDSDGTILWSWHIWVPASEVSDITNDAFCGTGVKIADRNLGAIEPVVAGESVVPTTSFGLYYQWGRKDPFITNDWGRNTSCAFSTSSTWVTTETANQNPTVLYKQKDESTSPNTYNWNSTEITDLWDNGGKTIYDPCPQGYRVAVFNSSNRFWKYDDTSGWEANTTYGWLKFGTITFPLAGYTENLSAYKVKERALLWSASYQDLERAKGLYTAALPNYPSYYKYYCANVRCVTVE